MKRTALVLSILLLVLTASIFGQNLSIQGVARDNTGQSLSDGSYGFTFRLYLVESGGTIEWTEDQTLTVVNGVFSAILGDVSSMADLNFDQEYWLSLEIDGNGELSPRTKLILSPYAIMAQTNQENVFPYSGSVGIGTASPSHELTVQGEIYASGFIGNKGTDMGQQMENGDATTTTLRFDSDNYRIYAGGTDGGGQIVTINESGKMGIGTAVPEQRLHIKGGTDVELNGGGYIQLGASDVGNLGVDENEIMARNNGEPANLYLNMHGGDVRIGGEVRSKVGTSTEFDKPFQFSRYSGYGKDITITTSWNSTDWICAVVGFDAGDGDVWENDAHNLWQVNAFVEGGVWKVRCESPTHGTNLPNWQVYLMFVNTKFGYASDYYKQN